MAVYRQLQIGFWQDYFVSELTPEQKYFYVYLMTNSMTKQCGIYQFNRRLASCDTNYTQDAVEKLLQIFVNYGKVLVSDTTGEIMIVNWLKYNFIKSRNTILCINKELKGVKDKKFLKVLYTLCREKNYPVDQIFDGIELPSFDDDVAEEGQTGGLKEAAEAQPGTLEGNDKGQAWPIEEGDKHHPRGLVGASQDLVEEEIQEEIKKEEEEGLAAAVDAFNKNIHPITPVVHERLEDWLKDVEPQVVIMAIEEAANNNARSMNYVNTVLNNWLAQGITSETAVRAYLKNRNYKKGGNYRSKGKSTDGENEEARPNAAAYRVIGGDEDE